MLRHRQSESFNVWKHNLLCKAQHVNKLWCSRAKLPKFWWKFVSFENANCVLDIKLILICLVVSTSRFYGCRSVTVTYSNHPMERRQIETFQQNVTRQPLDTDYMLWFMATLKSNRMPERRWAAYLWALSFKGYLINFVWEFWKYVRCN